MKHLSLCWKNVHSYTKPSKQFDTKIAVIGAGAAGLAALRHSLEENYKCEVFEQTGVVGGTWNYTDRVGKDEYGLPIHNSMYKGLRTNLPKEIMQFDSFPFVTPEHSYINQTEVLNYINNFAKHYNLLRHIKFFKIVTKVCPLEQGKWSVEVKDVKLKSLETKQFDAILVCVGNYSVPSIPQCKGLEHFHGSKIHSHDFRTVDRYKNRKVLIIGSGPSGIDISRLLDGVSECVILSHRSPLECELPNSIRRKPKIKNFSNNSVIFEDGTETVIDDVIFCTGYLYSYPFLTKDCKITVEDNWVKYLYKHIININHPTMGFIGIPFKVFPFVIFGIQVRFFLANLKKLRKTKEEMIEELLTYMNKRRKQGLPDNQAHCLSLTQGDYMNDLAITANISKVPSVYIKIYKYIHGPGKGKKDLSYRIINDNEFVVIEKCIVTK